MPRISKPPEERKQEIIETALALFTEKGYENTTIQDIAEKLNIAQGLCYRYFKSKQEIFAASSDYYAKKAVEHMTNSLNNNDTAIKKFNEVIRVLIAYAIKHSEFETTFKDEPEITADRIQKMAVYISNIMIPIIEQGIAEKSFICENVENTTRLLSYGIIYLIHYNMPNQNVKEHIISLFPTIRTACKNLLQIESEQLGDNWI